MNVRNNPSPPTTPNEARCNAGFIASTDRANSVTWDEKRKWLDEIAGKILFDACSICTEAFNGGALVLQQDIVPCCFLCCVLFDSDNNQILDLGRCFFNSYG